MDRSAVRTCAAIGLMGWAPLLSGCGQSGARPNQTTSAAPAILAELDRSSEGCRRLPAWPDSSTAEMDRPTSSIDTADQQAVPASDSEGAGPPAVEV